MKVSFFGMILFVGGLILMATNYKNLKIQQSGSIVTMRIEKLPASCLGTKTNHSVTLSYEGELFTKKIGGMFCEEHHVGEFIEMKYLDGQNIVMFPDESVYSNLIAFGLLSLIGLVFVFLPSNKK